MAAAARRAEAAALSSSGTPATAYEPQNQTRRRGVVLPEARRQQRALEHMKNRLASLQRKSDRSPASFVVSIVVHALIFLLVIGVAGRAVKKKVDERRNIVSFRPPPPPPPPPPKGGGRKKKPVEKRRRIASTGSTSSIGIGPLPARNSSRLARFWQRLISGRSWPVRRSSVSANIT